MDKELGDTTCTVGLLIVCALLISQCSYYEYKKELKMIESKIQASETLTNRDKE